MMIPRPLSTIQLPRMLRACIFAVLLCAFFGAIPDTLAQTKPQLCTALDLSTDNCSQIQSVSSDPPSFPWQITTDTSVAGGSSLRSAPVGDSEQSCLVLEVTLSANSVISVASRSSSQGGFDQLQISAGPLRPRHPLCRHRHHRKAVGTHNLLSAGCCHSTALVLCQGQCRPCRRGPCLDRQPEFQYFEYFRIKAASALHWI